MNESSCHVIELLDYIEQIEKLKKKPVFSVPTEHFVAYQNELQGLPELEVNLQSGDDDIWLSLPRLQEIAAPIVSEQLEPWVSLPKTPEKLPALKSEYVAYDSKEKAIHYKLSDYPEVRELFDWYVENQWKPWAEGELPRRRLISLYNKLFSLQQVIVQGGAETPLELVWGIGFATWKKQGFEKIPLSHPLIVQVCEISLNQETFALEVRPRNTDPRLELDCYLEMEVSGVSDLEGYWKSVLAKEANRPNPFEPSTYEGILKAAVGYLDPTGVYEEREPHLESQIPDEHLKITNNWILFGRNRSSDIFLEDVRRLKENIKTISLLPEVIQNFVTHGDDTVKVKPEQPFRGLSSSDNSVGAFELYFSLPYNDEQVSIIQKLENSNGVVVQGPPGTGKTHTIANIISHYLAQGKRVLVTAKSETALAVLREKLPERIRSLSVALLSDERDGMKQFEHSIQTIASRVAGLNPSRTERSIADIEGKIDQLHAEISYIDQSLTKYAAKHMEKHSFQGKKVTAAEMAKLVVEQAVDCQWFDDEPSISLEHCKTFNDSDINSLRQARMRLGVDLPYVKAVLPVPSVLPEWEVLRGFHQDLIRAKRIESKVLSGDLISLVDARTETLEKAKVLIDFLDERNELNQKLSIGAEWVNAFRNRLVKMCSDDPIWLALQQFCTEVKEQEELRKELLLKAIEVPRGAELNQDFNDALARLVVGKSAFGMRFGKGEARKALQLVKILGAFPKEIEEWRAVQKFVNWRKDVRTLIVRWNALVAEFSFEKIAVDSEINSAFLELVKAQALIEDAHRLYTDFDSVFYERLNEVFGRSVAEKVVNEEGNRDSLSEVYESLVAHVDKGRLGYAKSRIHEILMSLQGCSGEIVDKLKDFLINQVGNQTIEEAILEESWASMCLELDRLYNLRPFLDEVARMITILKEAGAPKWAKRIETEHATNDTDLIVPLNWREAWNWRRADIFLESIEGHKKLRKLFQQRNEFTKNLASTYEDIVAEKAWLKVHKNSPDSVRQALQGYLNAVQAIGKGTGIRAKRHRMSARKAMERAYQAVPCWILPHWRVSETIPSEVALFDLVIVDEASQSDISSLPVLLRGKKLLIVGDQKQVSPSAVGVAEERIKDLASRYLKSQPHGFEMTPDKSIYDLASVVFAGNSVMLREHFRCVPAIIEYSNREFYKGDIKALRIPTASERLDPPLIGVFVKGGFRKGDVNLPEAKAIVAEIESILADEQFADRSIGVVTLLGNKQAALIQGLINNQISQKDISERKIIAGNPTVFQGSERDIMMVSMVLAPGKENKLDMQQGSDNALNSGRLRAVANKLDMQQRFNVALSRARDRTYLFYSVPESKFSEDSLNARLIRHFHQPFMHDENKVQTLREKCESGFELEMYDELVKRGYRVQPQVQSGGYRIDFVVEGSEGRRLAIECDGDRYHGPDKWADDMNRQRVLERVGWTFWRCFASDFVRQRDEVIADLVQTLEKEGIEPLGSELIDNTKWSIIKTVNPCGVGLQSEELE